MLNIRKVGIVGEGKMGSGIFHYLLDYKFELVWVCSAGADSEKIVRQFEKRSRRSFEAGIIDQARYDTLLTTPITADIHALKDCDLVIEAIPEDPALKRDLFTRLEKIVNLFKDCGIVTQMVHRILGRLWCKVIIYSAINPLSAILKVPNGCLTTRPESIT